MLPLRLRHRHERRGCVLQDPRPVALVPLATTSTPSCAPDNASTPLTIWKPGSFASSSFAASLGANSIARGLARRRRRVPGWAHCAVCNARTRPAGLACTQVCSVGAAADDGSRTRKPSVASPRRRRQNRRRAASDILGHGWIVSPTSPRGAGEARDRPARAVLARPLPPCIISTRGGRGDDMRSCSSMRSRSCSRSWPPMRQPAFEVARHPTDDVSRHMERVEAG